MRLTYPLFAISDVFIGTQVKLKPTSQLSCQVYYSCVFSVLTGFAELILHIVSLLRICNLWGFHTWAVGVFLFCVCAVYAGEIGDYQWTYLSIKAILKCTYPRPWLLPLLQSHLSRVRSIGDIHGVSDDGDKVQAASDDDTPKCMSLEDMSWIQDYVSQRNGAKAVAHFRRTLEVLLRATSKPTRGEAVELVKLCNLLPGVIRRTLRGKMASEQTNLQQFQVYILGIVCTCRAYGSQPFSLHKLKLA